MLNYETNHIKTLICRDEDTNAIELSPRMPSSKGFQDMKPIDIKVNNQLGAIFILRKGVFGLFQTTHSPL